MRRVAVVGSGGAGKSTFARRLGEAVGLPVVHLDRLFWKPGWVETPSAEWRHLQEALVRPEQWVIDGNYGATLDIRVRAADTVVFFDFPRVLCLRRALWRSLRNHGKELQAPGCPERVDLQFLRWIWNYPDVSRPRILRALTEHAGHADVITVHGPRDAARLLGDLGPAR